MWGSGVEVIFRVLSCSLFYCCAKWFLFSIMVTFKEQLFGLCIVCLVCLLFLLVSLTGYVL